MAQLLGRLRSVLVFAAVIVFTGGGVGFSHAGTSEVCVGWSLRLQ